MEHARRRVWTRYRIAVAAAVMLTLAGTAVAVVAYRRNSDAAGVVADYFSALRRADAPGALALGDVPAGARELLTVRVLREQQRIAPLGDVSVGNASGTGDRMTVPVTYTLAFDGHPQPEATSVGVHRGRDGWRLDRVAVGTELMVAQAGQRATVLGAKLPVGTVLLFPGAVPVTYDTPYLQVSPPSADIDFQTGATAELVSEVSPAGDARATRQVDDALRACLGGHGSAGCPLPDERYVPGSLRGTLATKNPPLNVDIGSGAAGTIDVTGVVDVDGTYRRLDFRNRTVRGEGSLQLHVNAVAYATAPLTFVWETA